MTTRENVYKCIDGEREYQNKLNWNHKDHPSLEAEILLMEEYLLKARQQWTNSDDDTLALDIIRKITGMGVRCLENHGCPERQIKNEM